MFALIIEVFLILLNVRWYEVLSNWPTRFPLKTAEIQYWFVAEECLIGWIFLRDDVIFLLYEIIEDNCRARNDLSSYQKPAGFGPEPAGQSTRTRFTSQLTLNGSIGFFFYFLSFPKVEPFQHSSIGSVFFLLFYIMYKKFIFWV